MPTTTSVGSSMKGSTSSWNPLTPSIPFGDPSFAESRPRAILHTDVVVRFGPVHADKDLHRASSRCREPEEAIGPLMEVLEVRHPTSRVGILTDQQGHGLGLGLKVQLK